MDHADSLLDGLDVAEDVTPPETPEQPPEPKPEEAKAPEKPPEDAAAPDTEKKPETKEPEKQERKSIPLAAHLEEKRRWESKHSEYEQNFKALKAELDSLKNPPKQPAPEPDFTQDPRGYVDHKIGAALTQLESGTKAATQTAEQAAAAAEETRFMHALQTNEQMFAAQAPDYFAALDHLRGLREAELTTLHPDVPLADIRKFMAREELQLAASLFRSGRNPSEVAYSLAKARGYTKKQAASEPLVLPDVPKPKQLAPDQTLGSGAGSPSAGEELPPDGEEAFDKVFNELFGRKRA